MITAQNKKILLGEAEKLAARLAEWRAPDGSRQGVERSFLGTVHRFLRARPTPADARLFLELLPTSSLANYTRGAREQTAKVAQELRGPLGQWEQRVKGDAAEHLAYLVGWTMKLMQQG